MKDEKTGQNQDIPPKKSNTFRTCCIVALIVFVAIILLSIKFLRIFYHPKSKNPIPYPLEVYDLNKETSTKSSDPTNKPTAMPTAKVSISNITDVQIMDFFIYATTYNSLLTGRMPLARWTKNPIKVQLGGDTSDLTVKVLDKIITDFNGSSNTKLERVSNSGDLIISVLPRSEIPKIDNDTFKGYANAPANSKCIINSGKIYIDNAEMQGSEIITSEDLLALTMRHELLHAIGFSGHDTSKNHGCTAFSSIACLVYSYTEFDQAAIKMLYNSGVPLCSNESAIRKYFGSDLSNYR